MEERKDTHGMASVEEIEYQKGCPLCEHNDPDLERELNAWAQLLYDHFLSQRKSSEFRDANLHVDTAC